MLDAKSAAWYCCAQYEETTTPAADFYSGSDDSGTFSFACGDWAANTGMGTVGNSGQSGTGWLEFNDPTVTCGASLQLICAAW